jgi:hypothetical protein
MGIRRLVLAALATLAAFPVRADARALAVAWNDPDSERGALAAMRVVAPWDFLTPALEVGPNAVLHARGRDLFAVSPTDGTITAVDVRSWTIERTYELDAESDPQDIAVTPDRRAYVTRSGATHLLRLDLRTGEAVEVVDLGIFADSDGLPDLGRMVIHRGRLFVQLRRFDASEPGAFAQPLLAVVDLATEQLVDVDPDAPGVQAIELAGTPPRFRMQVFWRTRELMVSSTGNFFDQGGLELIDLTTLRSKGLVIREEDGNVGSDLGAFVRVATDRGFLAYSTDLLLSSHLHSFTFSGEVGPELQVSLDYFTPALAHDRPTDAIFSPDGNFGTTGIRVFDAETEAELTAEPTRTSGVPTDLLLLRATPRPAAPPD